MPELTLELVDLRASQLNGCEVCLEGGTTLARRHGETDERLAAVAAWRGSALFTEAEQAALALAEAVTNLDADHPVPDDVWGQAAGHYDEAALGALVLHIAATNVWNRLNVTTCQDPGAWQP